MNSVLWPVYILYMSAPTILEGDDAILRLFSTSSKWLALQFFFLESQTEQMELVKYNSFSPVNNFVLRNAFNSAFVKC